MKYKVPSLFSNSKVAALRGGILLVIIGGIGLAIARPAWLVNILPRKRPRLVPLPDLSPAPKEPERSTNGIVKLFISAQPSDVYPVVRSLANLQDLVPCIESVQDVGFAKGRITIRHDDARQLADVSVIADQPGEFIAFRLDSEGQLLGTCLLKLESAPGNIGVVLSLTIKFAPDTPSEVVRQLFPIALTELHSFSENVKQACESGANAGKAVVPQ